MAANHLSKRDNWQTNTGKKAKRNEKKSFKLLNESLDREKYSITVQPTISIALETIRPELCIENTLNGKKLLLDDKLGENGGNAHERLYGYFTPKRLKQFQDINCTPLVLLSGRTFAAKKPFIVTRYDKKNNKYTNTSVNPQKYRDQLESRLEKDNYFIMSLDNSNCRELVNLIEKLLS